MDSAGGQELSEETKAERLMRLRLPAYIVNCLLVAGFDTLDVIAKMDVRQEPGNSIEMVENFVTANFSGDERCMYAPLGIYSFNSQRCQNATETGIHFTEICLLVPKSGSL